MKKNKGVVWRLLKYIGRHKLLFVLACSLALFGTLADLFIPLMTARAIDCISIEGVSELPLMMSYIVKIVLLAVISLSFKYLSGMLINVIVARVANDMRIDGFSKMQRLPMSFFDSASHGDIISRLINDIDLIGEGLTQTLENIFSGFIMCAGSLLFAFLLSWKIALCLLLISPLYYLIARFISSGSVRLFARQQDLVGNLSAAAEESADALEVLRAFSLEEQSQENFEEINSRLYDVGWKAQFYSALANPSTRLIVHSSYILVGTLGAMGILGGSLTLGLVSGLLTYSSQYSKPINELTGVIAQFQLALASAGRFFSFMSEEEETDDSKLPALSVSDSTASFEAVSFSYREDTPLIDDLSFAVPPNSRVAIVGATGAGKTTLINLLMRYYEPRDGVISVGGTDISSVSRNSVRENFSMVLQDTWIFSGTVRENISFSKPNSTEEEILEAAKKSHAHSFIKRLPNGYDTVLPEGGGSLSGGQKQLLTIARAMLIDTPMLILDEATSSVDTLTEVRIQKAFRKMMKDKTSFVIAHRLSTIKDSDLILVMDNGNVAEQGTHETLLQANGIYAKMYRNATA
ncbi:MAG: ABC transporter ATP-binding protein/permease [Oscillospiraceae bacterium]|jgi:ABC-type multidrug transport system fused ATPase/permease subunit|nr:ABC transporter ATP-binding protein/permease [Oscillospiraceae bacterium]